MDSEEKHGAWIGGMYEKVGTLCSGIDNIISQDFFQYAETQFLTAGVNVKQFTENKILAAGANVIQFAEDQFSTTGANVKQFAEDQFLTTGANVKQLCSNFMQEVLSDLMKDSFVETSQSKDTEKCDWSSCETLEKEDDRCHKDEVSKSDNSDVASSSGFSTVAREMILEQNHIKVNVISSEILQVDVSEKNGAGMKPSIHRVDQSHDGGIEDQIDLQSLKSVLSQPSYSSKGDRNTEPELSILDHLICHHNAIVSSGIDDSRILVNEDDSTETCSGFFEADDSLTFSLIDGPDDGKADQTKDNYSRETGLNNTEPVDNMMAMDCYAYPMLSSNKSCSPPDFQVEQGNYENGWEFMEMVGYEDHPVESNEPQGISPKQSLQPKESKYKIDIESCESCESDWEII